MRPRKLRQTHHKRTIRKAVAAVAVGASLGTLTGLGIIYATEAKALPPNCEEIPWGLFQNQRRQICDTPVRPDGSWTRFRLIAVPAHYRNPTSSCYGSYGYSSCTIYPGGNVAQQNIEDTSYVVFPDNVLPNEPGHLG